MALKTKLTKTLTLNNGQHKRYKSFIRSILGTTNSILFRLRQNSQQNHFRTIIISAFILRQSDET